VIDLRSVLFLTGTLLTGLTLAMVIPFLTEFFIYDSLYWAEFLISIFICGFFGGALSFANRPHGPIVLGMREAFLVTSLSWVVLSVFAGLPFYYSNLDLNFTNACFEAVSSLTTTGSTVIKGLDRSPKGILLWRAILQWLGGTGIIVMAMTIFPTLRIGGMQLFRSEFSDQSEKILPRVSQIASAILTAYVFFTVVCGILLYWAGMAPFDAICHAMASVSTGGLSTKDASIGAFNSPLIELIVIVFMILGGSTLILYVRLWNGDTKAIRRDSQLKVYLSVLCLASLAISIWNWGINKIDFLTSLRQGTFSAVSMITTTGFITADYGKWGGFPIMFFFILSLIGGCTGSTTGGIKIFRFQILFSLVKTQLMQLRRPHGVYVPLYQNQKVSDAVAFSVFTFVALYCFCLVILSLVFSSMGMDFIASLSGAASCLGNIGPGLGEHIGPHTSFASLSEAPKLAMMLGMILGRLELLTVLVLFMPTFWRD